MKSKHSEYWSSEIHCQHFWTCIAVDENDKAVHENDTTYAFSTKEELMSHFTIHHPKLLPESEQPSTHVGGNSSEPDFMPAQRHWSQGSRQVSSCPLCLFSMEETPVDEPNDERKITSWAMGSHIADHLHHIMIVSLQIMTSLKYAAEDDDDNIRFQSSGPSTALSGALSGLDEDAMKKRLKERVEGLPEDVQGDIDNEWFDSPPRAEPHGFYIENSTSNIDQVGTNSLVNGPYGNGPLNGNYRP
jgi:hypothetical protein